jgi:hypothetical protein
MNQELWLKRRAECKAAAPLEKPSKYILVTCRELEVAEKRILGKNFQQIHVYNSELDRLDMSKLTFDLLVVDASSAANHLFLEMVSPSCASLNIPIIVLKQPLSNYKKLAEDLQAYMVSRIEFLEGPHFFQFLTKTKLRKLESRWITVLKRLFRMLF